MPQSEHVRFQLLNRASITSVLPKESNSRPIDDLHVKGLGNHTAHQIADVDQHAPRAEDGARTRWTPGIVAESFDLLSHQDITLLTTSFGTALEPEAGINRPTDASTAPRLRFSSDDKL